MPINIPNGWIRRKYQKGLWDYLEKGGKRAVAVWHRRAGKDDVALHWAAVATTEKVGTYWHMLPEAAQARKAIWDAINPHTGIRRIDEAFPKEIRSNTNEHEMFIRFRNGSTWQVVGSDNFNSLVGSPPIGVVFSEWSIANPAAWSYIRPILAENGGWAIFIYTPRGKNHGYSLLQVAKDSKDWYHEVLTADKTGVFSTDTLAQELKEYTADLGIEGGRAMYEQEYFCSFEAAVLWAVYGASMTRMASDNRIVKNLYDTNLPVYTAWDLGYSDHTSIWFYQVVMNEVRLIDYHEDRLKDVPHYCDYLKEKTKVRGFRYERHYVPHDAANKLQAAGGRSIQELMFAEGIQAHVIPATAEESAINATRAMLDITYIDGQYCEIGIEHAKQYHYRFDERLNDLSRKPVHDKHSHGCKALEIIARVWHNPIQESPTPAPKYLHDMTADDLFWGDKTRKVIHERY